MRLKRLAEREGFEPPCRLPGKTLSRRPRYDHFGTSPEASPAATLPTLSEKLLNRIPALRFEHAARRGHSMIQRRVLVGAHGRLNRARFWFNGSVDQTCDPGVNHCANAHLARF